MAFLIAEFVLVMQFLWKYLDEIIGKGISFGVLLEFIFYFAVRIIPEAVPVTILIASVMVFGNLAEKYEISSMKSAGISLTRIMAAGIALSVFTALFSLLASNYLKPRANYKFRQRYLTIFTQEATLNIQEGVFAYDFKNFTINVGKKLPDGERIEDVLIYDNSGSDKSQLNMLTAKRGKMYSSDDKSYFVMDLEDGEQYRELTPNKKKNSKPFIRTTFEKWSRNFDMSDFQMEATDLNQHKSKHDLLNTWQLLEAIDSFDLQIAQKATGIRYDFDKLITLPEIKKPDTTLAKPNTDALPEKLTSAIAKKDRHVKDNLKRKKKPTKPIKKQKDTLNLAGYKSLLETFKENDAKSLIKTSKYQSGKINDQISKVERDQNNLTQAQSRYILRFHQQFSWALICIVFLFIGAPLGSIVKKGGYGYPLLIAIIFFMLFIILNILGEKLNKTGEINPVLAAWLPNLVLIPIAIITSYKALNDSTFRSNTLAKLKARLFLSSQ